MEGGGLENDPSKAHEAVQVNTEKTYKTILAHKQAQLAKEAKFERRCQALTKRFLKDREDLVKDKQERANEASQKSYERNMQKVVDSQQADSLLRQMVKEERNQISQLMHEKAKQREAEEEKKAEKEAERNYYIQARIHYDQQQADKRHKKVEEDTKQRLDSIKERMEQHRVTSDELKKQQGEERKSVEDKLHASMAKVDERRKKTEIEYRKDRHERLSARAQKQKDALEVRQKRNEQVKQNARDATEKWSQRVEQRRLDEEERVRQKTQQILGKAQAVEERLENARQESFSARDHHSQNSSTMEYRKQQQQQQQQQQQEQQQSPEAAPKIEDRGRGIPMPSCWSPELVAANTQVQKDYFQKVSEMKEAEHRMLMRKRYKKLEEGAKESEEDQDTVRLRSLHSMYIAQKPREPHSKDTPISSRSSVRPSPRPPRHGRCGLCEREYPMENLVGSALRRTVERLRHQSPNLPKTGRGVKERPAVYGQQMDHLDGATQGTQGPVINDEIVETARSGLERQGLYDYEVKLCINCDIFVRIAST